MAYCIGFIVTEEAESEIITQEVFPAEVARREVLVQTVRPGETEEAAQNLLRAGAQALVARGGNFRDLQRASPMCRWWSWSCARRMCFRR